MHSGGNYSNFDILLENHCYCLRDENFSKFDSFNPFRRHFLVGFEWSYFSVAHLEPKMWQKKCNLTLAVSPP